jgi:hypothetical protein
MGTGVCFRYGKSGHFAKSCPMEATRNQGTHGTGFQQKQPTQARVYSLTPASTDTKYGNADVVTGTIPLFGSLAFTLFDLSATHSLISSSYVKLCNLSMKPLEQDICVATPVGNVVTCRKYVEDSPIIIRDKTLPAKLVVLKCLDSRSF